MSEKQISDSDLYETPPAIFDWLEEKHGPFFLDVCAQKSTAKCRLFFSPERGEDALSMVWSRAAKVAWCNPPYSNPKPWIEKAIEESKHMKVVMLLPADTSTSWYRLLRYTPGVLIEELPKRIRFYYKGKPAKWGSKFGSIVAIIDRRPMP